MIKNTLGEIDQNSPVPLYYQIHNIILEKIDAKEFVPHQQIPSEDELASMFEVSRMTSRQAVLKLLNEGRIYRKRGQGTFVAEPKIERKVARLTTFEADMKEAGLRPKAVVIQKNTIKAVDEVKKVLKLEEEEPVVKTVRLRLANDQPIAIAISVVPVKVCPSLEEETLEGVISLTMFMEEKYGLKIAYAEQKIQAIRANSYQSKLLKTKKGNPLLQLHRVFYSSDHTPVGLFESFYRGDRYVFTSTLYR
jgi:GntR family transcriptional regulator